MFCSRSGKLSISSSFLLGRRHHKTSLSPVHHPSVAQMLPSPIHLSTGICCPTILFGKKADSAKVACDRAASQILCLVKSNFKVAISLKGRGGVEIRKRHGKSASFIEIIPVNLGRDAHFTKQSHLSASLLQLEMYCTLTQWFVTFLGGNHQLFP